MYGANKNPLTTTTTVVGGSPVKANTIAPTVIYAPAPGKSIRLKWMGLSSPAANAAEVIASVYIGTTLIYQWSMGNPGAFAHSSTREGAPDEKLTIVLSADGQDVYVNLDVLEF